MCVFIKRVRVCLCVCVSVHTNMCMHACLPQQHILQKSKDNFEESVLSFHHDVCKLTSCDEAWAALGAIHRAVSVLMTTNGVDQIKSCLAPCVALSWVQMSTVNLHARIEIVPSDRAFDGPAWESSNKVRRSSPQSLRWKLEFSYYALGHQRLLTPSSHWEISIRGCSLSHLLTQINHCVKQAAFSP